LTAAQSSRHDPGVADTLEGARKARRWRRLLWRVLFYGVAIFAGLPLALSQSLVRPARLSSPQPPPPGWKEERIVCEGLHLRTWTLPGRSERPAAVVVHGVGDSLESFTEIARRLNDRGQTVLLLDTRGHGGSEGSLTTLGGREREDVRTAMRHLRDHGLAGKGFLLMGVSMGAVAVLRAAAVETDVRAVVVEAPFDTYRETVAHHARLLFHLPRGFPLIPLTIKVAEWRAGFDADDVDAVGAARLAHGALLAIADGADPRMPPEVVRRVFDAHPGPKTFWMAPRAPHAGASAEPDYWPQVEGFLSEQGM
jgi:pimeloyl-ACP methyl ester carboxylesterase